MGLDPSSRGAVEQMIDLAVKLVSDTARIFTAPAMKSNFQISSESDFVLGVTYGRIMMSITTFWNLTHKRAMTGEELDEINNAITRRMPEIHKAISNVWVSARLPKFYKVAGSRLSHAHRKRKEDHAGMLHS